tara:strand:+ start:222 stop:428 length:207 start_codon:yes stop_codon:yes gene_type:complete
LWGSDLIVAKINNKIPITKITNAVPAYEKLFKPDTPNNEGNIGYTNTEQTMTANANINSPAAVGFPST